MSLSALNILVLISSNQLNCHIGKQNRAQCGKREGLRKFIELKGSLWLGKVWGVLSSSQVARSHAGQAPEGWAGDFPVSLLSKCTESLLWNIRDLNHSIYLILTIWPWARSWWYKDEYDSVPALKHSQSNGKDELIKSNFERSNGGAMEWAVAQRGRWLIQFQKAETTL